MLVDNRLILGVVGPSVFPWAESVLMSLTRTDKYSKCYTFFHPANNLVFNLSPPRALGSSKGGLLWEINLDRSIFPKKNKYNSKAVSFFFPAAFCSERFPFKNPGMASKAKRKKMWSTILKYSENRPLLPEQLYICMYIYIYVYSSERTGKNLGL